MLVTHHLTVHATHVVLCYSAVIVLQYYYLHCSTITGQTEIKIKRNKLEKIHMKTTACNRPVIV